MALPPLDHRIPMATMPADVPVQTPQDWQRISSEREQAEIRNRNEALILRQNERKEADERAMRQIAAESGGDWDVMIERASRLNPALAATLTEQRAKTKTAVAEAYTKQIAAEKQRTERGIAFLRVAASDPELYQQMRPTLAPLLPEELQAALPEQHDPQRIAYLYEAALDAKTAMERADDLHKRIQSGDALKGVLGLLAEQDTQEEYEGVLQAYAAFLPKGSMALIPKWSPDAPAKAAQLAMTPDQRVDNKRADVEAALSAERLDLARQAEARQARQGDARLALSRQAAARAAQGGGTGEALPTPTARLNATLSLQNRYTAQTKAAAESARAVSNMRSSLQAVKNGSMPAGSQGVLVTFQKILDPESVVRESEYARSQSGLSLASQLRGQYDRIVSGGAGVPVAELEKYVRLAEEFDRNIQASAGITKKQIDGIAREYGLNPENITREFGTSSGAPSQAPRRMKIKGGGIAEQQPDGTWKRVQ